MSEDDMMMWSKIPDKPDNWFPSKPFIRHKFPKYVQDKPCSSREEYLAILKQYLEDHEDEIEAMCAYGEPAYGEEEDG